MPRQRPAGVEVVTIPGVELVRLGSWLASTGPVDVTAEDLASFVAAANDPEVDDAPLRIGHVDARFDGEPALGWLANLRVAGDRLLGDLVDVPAKLAAVIPRAFRRRSVEIAWGVRTPSGRKYRAALAGLALLGVQPPAVKGLADVVGLYGLSGPLELDADNRSAFTFGDTPADNLEVAVAGIHTPTNPSGHTVTDDPTPPGGPTVPLTDERIRELLRAQEGEDLEALLAQIGTERAGTEPPATPPPPADPPATPPATPPVGDPPAEPATTPPATPPADPPATPPAEGATPPATPELVGAGVATLSTGALAQLQAQATQGAEAMAILAAQRREGVLASALSSGRITPADREAWATRLEADEAGTTALLSSLTPAFPVAELGADLAPNNDAADAAWDAFYGDVFGIEPSTKEEPHHGKRRDPLLAPG